MGMPAPAALFNTVPARDYLQFWQSGRFQPQRVARFLGLKKVELAQLAAVAPASVRFDDKSPRILRERLMDIAATCELVAQAFDGNITKTSLWFMTRNPQLGDLSPCDLLRRGGLELLQRQVLEAARAGGAAMTVPQPDADSLSPHIPAGRALLDARQDEIEHLCRRHAVRSLAVFGSVLRQHFDPDHGAFDLAVHFAPSAEGSPGRRYSEFKQDLEQLLKCQVDLVELNAMPDSRLRRSILSAQTLLYDAAT
jgi:predicted nucleotidyltransferase